MDFKNITFECLFHLNDFGKASRSLLDAKPYSFSTDEMAFIRHFELDTLLERCTGKGKGKDDVNGTPLASIKAPDPEEAYLHNASAGEKNRLHAMACSWKAYSDPKVQLVVWDEGEQGLSTDMYLRILAFVSKAFRSKTFVVITHCPGADVALKEVWDKVIRLKTHTD